MFGRPKDCKGTCAGYQGLTGESSDACYWKSPEGLKYKKEHGMP